MKAIDLQSELFIQPVAIFTSKYFAQNFYFFIFAVYEDIYNLRTNNLLA